MIPRLLLLALALVLASCAPQTLTLNYPATWQPADRTKPPRWVVAYPTPYAAPLTPLKKARRDRGYEVISLPNATTETIRQETERLQLGSRNRDCLLLVGPSTDLPGLPGLHHRMRGRSSDSRYALSLESTTPLYPVGRLAATSPAQARGMVSKILSFERDHAQAGRRASLLAGNPMPGNDHMRSADWLVSSLSKKLIRKPHSSWTFSGVADVIGHPYAVEANEFAPKFSAILNQPYAVGTYFGHSNSRVLCSSGGQVVFGNEDWNQLSPSTQRGLFLSCGCYCLERDNAIGYKSVQAPGGPVAFIGATGESYAAVGFLAAKGLVGSMTDSPPATIGEWWINVQNAIAATPMNRTLFTVFDKVDGSNGQRSLRDQRLEHLEMWMLLGDPATRIF